MNEIWKDINDYEGLYQISNFGRVKALERTVEQLDRTGKPSKSTYPEKMLNWNYRVGYPYVVLSKNNKQQKFNVHRLVAIHFIPNPKNLLYVNHLDSNRANPRIDNLEWCTNSRNQKHSFENGRIPLRGTEIKHAKLSESDVLEIRKKYIQGHTSYRKLADEYGVSYSSVHELIIRKTWKHI